MAGHESFPNWEALVAAILRTELDNVRVYSSLPKKQQTFPLIIVHRYGGTPIEEHHLDLASLQIDVWGNDKSEARSLADQARVALLESEGQYEIDDDYPVKAFVAKVKISMGLSWQPDPITNKDRYIFGITMAGHE